MRDYELTVLFKPDLGEKELDKAIKSLQDLLAKIGAKIKAKKDAEKRPLAYEIAHNREAFYVFLELELGPGEVSEVDLKLKSQEGMVRYLLVSK